MSVDYVKKIKKLVADKSGHEIEEIEENTYFEDDLNISEMELIDILTDLEDSLKIELIENKNDIETVGDLIDMVAEQVD